MEAKTSWCSYGGAGSGAVDLLKEIATKVFCKCGGKFDIDGKTEYNERTDATGSSSESWDVTYFVCQKCNESIMVRRQLIYFRGSKSYTVPDDDGIVCIYNSNFAKKLTSNIKDLDPQIARKISENFWELM